MSGCNYFAKNASNDCERLLLGIFLCDMYVTDTRFNQISTLLL